MNLLGSEFNRDRDIESKGSVMKVLKKKNIVKKIVRKSVKRGSGLVDTLIDKLPVELHLPGYNYCGPGTKLSERLERGDKGVNGLDELCKTHDIAYATHKDSTERKKADKELASGAFKRLLSKDASIGERAASLLVTSAMKAKASLSKFSGGGIFGSCKRRRRRSKGKMKKSTKKSSFAALVRGAKMEMKKSKANTVGTAFMAAYKAAKMLSRGKRVKVPRIIKVPKIGGILPILPILAGLGAIGSLVGSAASVVKTIKGIRNAREQLAENKRHNKAMEMKVGSGLYLGMRKNGSGLYLRPKGKGLYLKPAPKNYR